MCHSTALKNVAAGNHGRTATVDSVHVLLKLSRRAHPFKFTKQVEWFTLESAVRLI